MYVKMMHASPKNNGEKEFTMLQIHKGQSISFMDCPGMLCEMQVIENDVVTAHHSVTGPVYVMSESGKTIAQYAMAYGAPLGDSDIGSTQVFG